jgi:hypothetical protein
MYMYFTRYSEQKPSTPTIVSQGGTGLQSLPPDNSATNCDDPFFQVDMAPPTAGSYFLNASNTASLPDATNPKHKEDFTALVSAAAKRQQPTE